LRNLILYQFGSFSIVLLALVMNTTSLLSSLAISAKSGPLPSM